MRWCRRSRRAWTTRDCGSRVRARRFPTEHGFGAGDAARRLEAARALPRELTRRTERVRTRYAHAVERLHGASPLAILERGYAVVTGPDGAVLREAAAVGPGDSVRVRLARGALGARVTDIDTESQEGR